MEGKKPNDTASGAVVLLLIGLFGGLFLVNKLGIPLGNFVNLPPQTVTVTGTAKTESKTQIANFSAGVNVVSSNKDEAIGEVNKKVEEIISVVTKFGIDKKDIQTQNLSVWQDQERNRWNVNNTVTIKLRDVDKASEFSDILFKTGANNVYGPNFSLDDTDDVANSLTKLAVDDARKKAENMAISGGRKLGKVLSITEGSTYSPVYPLYSVKDAGGGGGAPVEPGTGTVSTSVTVVFELK